MPRDVQLGRKSYTILDNGAVTKATVTATGIHFVAVSPWEHEVVHQVARLQDEAARLRDENERLKKDLNEAVDLLYQNEKELVGTRRLRAYGYTADIRRLLARHGLAMDHEDGTSSLRVKGD